MFIVSLQRISRNDMIMYRSRSGWSRNGRVAFSNQSAQISLGDIKAADASRSPQKLKLFGDPNMKQRKERYDSRTDHTDRDAERTAEKGRILL